MIAHSLKICKDLREHDSALRLAFSFFQALHLLLEIFVAQIVRLLLKEYRLAEYPVGIVRSDFLHIIQRLDALLFHLLQLFQHIVRKLQIPLFHI